MRRWRRAVVLSSVLLLTGLAGCTSVEYPAGEGTELRDGFEVLDGSRLLGPLFQRLDDYPGTTGAWSAVLGVTGDPAAVWRSYLDAADPELNPDLPGEGLYGCYPETDRPERSACQAALTARSADNGTTMTVTFQLATSASDITGHYLLQIDVSPGSPPTDGGPPFTGSLSFVLPPERDPPGEGQRLTDYGLREVEPGSSLVAAYTGYLLPGFVLAVDPDADVDDLAEAYVGGHGEYGVHRLEAERQGVVYRTLSASIPGDGGSIRIHTVDQEGTGGDYLYVEPFPD